VDAASASKPVTASPVYSAPAASQPASVPAAPAPQGGLSVSDDDDEWAEF